MGFGPKSDPVRRRSNHAWTDDQAGRRERVNIDPVGGCRVHTADASPSRNAATRSKNRNFMGQGDARPRAAAGSSRNGTTQAVAARTGVQRDRNATSNSWFLSQVGHPDYTFNPHLPPSPSPDHEWPPPSPIPTLPPSYFLQTSPSWRHPADNGAPPPIPFSHPPIPPPPSPPPQTLCCSIVGGASCLPLHPHLRRVVTVYVCRYWVVIRMLTGCVRPRPCVRETCVR